jgi:peptidyl-prolyl cis-trans isomerase B (cyclophilin B)
MIARMAYPQPPPGNDWWGQPPQPAPGFYPPAYPPPRQTNSMAIVALVGALVFAPLGIVFGHIALSQIRRSDEDGKGLAIAGLAIGYILTGLSLLAIVFWVILFVVVANEIDRLPSTPTTYGTYSMQSPSMQSTTWTESTSPPFTVLCLVND